MLKIYVYLIQERIIFIKKLNSIFIIRFVFVQEDISELQGTISETHLTYGN
jgi:hypothetical protein